MELKKREEASKKNYAKKGELTKSELKSSTPKKWIVASALGVATLFYANPNSFFGNIGVVFGCAQLGVGGYNYSPLWHSLNNFSNYMGIAYKVIGIAAITTAAIELIDYRSF